MTNAAPTFYQGVSVTPPAGTYLVISTTCVDTATNAPGSNCQRLRYNGVVVAEAESQAPSAGVGLKKSMVTTCVAIVTADGTKAIDQQAANIGAGGTLNDTTVDGATPDKGSNIVLVRIG
jgi:hypothetical protein